MVTLKLQPVVDEGAPLRRDLGLAALRVFRDLVEEYGALSGLLEIWEVENGRGGLGIYVDEIVVEG